MANDDLNPHEDEGPKITRIPKVPPAPPTDEPETGEEEGVEGEGEANTEIEAIVEEGLPEPQAPAIPLTEEERDQRLGEIILEVNEAHTRYKQHARGALRYAVRMGKLLIEAKAIVGHGRFMPWVFDNCPFSHATAGNYMYVAERNLNFVRLTNLAERGTVEAISTHISKKSVAQQRRQDAKDRAEEKAERGPPPETLTEAYSQRDRKRRSFRDRVFTNRAQNRAAQQARSDEYEAINQPDLTTIWPGPHEDAAGLVVEWKLPDDVIIGIYVWLPEFAHASADAATSSHWRGGAALRYHWIIYKYFTGKGSQYRLETDHDTRYDNNESEEHHRMRTLMGNTGKTWEQVQEKLIELSREATSVIKAVALDRDPARTGILENWAFPSNKRQQILPILDPAPLTVS